MNIYLDCIPCFIRQGIDAARNATKDVQTHEQIIRDILRLAIDLNLNQPPPFVGQLIHRRLRELTGVNDPYHAAKSRFNQLALKMLTELRDAVTQDAEPLLTAAKIAIAANVIDLGVKSALSEEQAYADLREASRVPVHANWIDFKEKVKHANKILYLADNAGEIVLDRLLIEQLGPERVTLAVRGKPVINDATLDDAQEAGLQKLVQVIDNGSDAPGTILDDCSPTFQKIFHNADLIIAKGQGNYETLSQVDANILYLLKIKCPVIANHIGLPVGIHALLSSKHLSNNLSVTTNSP